VTELHSISAGRLLTGMGSADRMDPECEWTCTCGAYGIVGGRFVSKAEEAGRKHLLDVHGQATAGSDQNGS
jgi:hypothetical protein